MTTTDRKPATGAPVSILMYDKSYAHIGPRLGALGLDVRVHTFDRELVVHADGKTIPPEEMSIDYVWLQAAINADGLQAGAFALVERLRTVGVLQTFNAGLDHPFYKRMSAKGTRLLNSSAQGIAISEYVLAQVLALTQPIDRQRSLQAERTWQITPFRELSQTRWLVFGFGPIGREVTKRARAFDAHVTVVRRTPETEGLADAAVTMATMHDALALSDIVVLACPLNAETRRFADVRFFGALKEGTILVNVARGALIDDKAMLEVLETPRLAAAVLDVFAEEPLPPEHAYWRHPKVRMTGHTSFAGSGVRNRWDALFLDNIGRFVSGAALANEVDPRSLA